jgi:hypothetical protein
VSNTNVKYFQFNFHLATTLLSTNNFTFSKSSAKSLGFDAADCHNNVIELNSTSCVQAVLSNLISNKSASFVHAFGLSKAVVAATVRGAVFCSNNLNVLDFTFEGKFTFSAEELTLANLILNC